MTKWILKAAVQKTISFLPAKERINFFFQKHVTRGVKLSDQHLEYKLDAARDHIRYYETYGAIPRDVTTVLELGTGWYPIVPLMLFLAGFDRIVSIDIRKWTSKERQLVSIGRVLHYLDEGRLAAYLDRIVPERVHTLRGILASPEAFSEEAINELIQLSPRIMDATALDFPDHCFDFICSNNTFEHIYEPVLRKILLEFKRVLKGDGVMSHFIDLSDHFAHLDHSITIYNFLRFDAWQWRLIDNDIQPQNRLRWRDYRKLYHSIGMPIREESYLAGNVAAVRSARLSAEYAAYTPEELAISHGFLVS
ncbi:methyltransferase family protein [Neolewinella xylanilytica]|uniref:Methyltransferase family protein n=1 Tax=Neolewinella xylanilytica TaxID=1514080 RepID=A0A2S6I3A5_9BACT|nr:class I SAM-dependent methyltransferase [Neolewinella xylanilytica]PPK85664.1 methyltransferase family protein [Neolewinella xylanilytica]